MFEGFICQAEEPHKDNNKSSDYIGGYPALNVEGGVNEYLE